MNAKFTALHKLANDDDVRYQLGIEALQLDIPELAIGWFEAAFAINPQHLQARQACGGCTTINPCCRRIPPRKLKNDVDAPIWRSTLANWATFAALTGAD